MLIDTAMVLAAGLGTRFRKVSGDLPKPLVPVAGKPLIDWALDGLADGGVSRAVVNVHYKADEVEAHVTHRVRPKEIVISDERAVLLETGGGLMHASPLLGEGAVFCTNTDAILDPSGPSPVRALAQGWDDARMDALLLLVPVDLTTGYVGTGDFQMSTDGRLTWTGFTEPFVFTGLQIIHPRLWGDEPPVRQSTKVFWDRAMKNGRIYGLVFDRRWMHVGDPEGFAAATSILSGTE